MGYAGFRDLKRKDDRAKHCGAGLTRPSSLHSLFARARDEKKSLFFPYFCVGWPDFASSLAFADAALRSGASGLELGVPFSDPIADGPTLQKATQQALDRGTKFADVFRLARAIRSKGHRQPLLVMTYLNPVVQMGFKRFASQLESCGANGAIIPDLPLEESAGAVEFLGRKGLALIPFLAPTSGRAREKRVDALGAPFLYYVSLTGVTGARRALSSELAPNLRRLRRSMKTPVTVGFGISTPLQAAQVGRDAEGVIIASALINLIERTPKARRVKTVGAFCRSVVRAIKG